MSANTRAPSTIVTIALTGQYEFNIPFEYLARKYVEVTLLGVDRLPLTLNTDFRFVGKTTISLTRPYTSEYTQIELRRVTSATERLVDFHDGSILRAYDLNLSQIQTLHVAEEARDLTADTIGVNDEGHLDARNRKIVNVAYAEDGGDVVPLGQMAAWNTSALVSAERAEAARDVAYAAAEGAIASRDDARLSAAASLASAEGALESETNAAASEVASETSKDAAELAAERAEAASGPATAVFERLAEVEVKAEDANTTAEEAVTLATSTAELASYALSPVLSVAWVQLRSAMWNGHVAADGQLLNRVDYPAAWAAIQAGKVPVITDSEWNSFPAKRGSFTTGDGSTTFRVPDYNGKSANSLGAAFLRGDGLNSEGTNGFIQSDAIRNIEGKATNTGFGIVGAMDANIENSPLYITSDGPARFGSTAADASWGNVVNIDVSRAVPTAADNHPVNVTGCWAVKLFSAVQNSGTIDAAGLATQLAAAQSKIDLLEAKQRAYKPKRVWRLIKDGSVPWTTNANVDFGFDIRSAVIMFEVLHDGRGSTIAAVTNTGDASNYWVYGSWEYRIEWVNNTTLRMGAALGPSASPIYRVWVEDFEAG